MAKEKAPLTPLKLDEKTPLIQLTGKTVIYDQVFNYGRSIMPTDEEGNEKTLAGTVGEAEEQVYDGIFNEPLVRYSSPDEQQKWLELHSKDEWFAALSAEKQVAPSFILVDGFGRVNAFVEEQGVDEPFNAKLMSTYDHVDGLQMSLLLNHTQRGVSALNQAIALKKIQKAKGWNQSELAKRFGYTQAYVSQLMKVFKLKTEDYEKAVANKWSLRKICSVVEGYETKGDKDSLSAPRSDSGLKPKKKLKEHVIDSSLPVFLNALIDSKVSDTPEYWAVLGFHLALEWADGRHTSTSQGKKIPMKVMKLFKKYNVVDNDFLAEFDLTNFDFEADPAEEEGEEEQAE